MRSKWYFKDKDRILLELLVDYDEFVFDISYIVEEYASPLEQILCAGIEHSLMEDCETFSKFRKFFINDYHFERVE